MREPTDPLEADEVDFAVAAYRQDGGWRVAELSPDHAVDVDALVEALRRFPDDAGALALVAVEEDFFVLVRVTGGRTRLLLSDVSAALDFDLAADAVAHLGLTDADAEDDEGPAGDLDLLADLGLDADELADLIDDLDGDDEDDDLWPEEVLSEVAARLGFGPAFDDAVGLSPA